MLQAIVQNLEAGEGFRGDPMDRKITQRDLVNYGLASLKVAGNAKTGLVAPTVDDLTKNPSTPPVPTGLSASPGSFGLVNLAWTMPSYKNHGHTNVYRSFEDNFATATIVAKAIGGGCSDFIPLLDEHAGAYYWITFTTSAGVSGSSNASAGVFAQRTDDAPEILASLVKKISFEHLSEPLSKRVTAPIMTEIAGPVAGTGAFIEVASQAVSADGPAIMEIIANASISGPEAALHEFRVLINGVVVAGDTYNIVNSHPNIAYAKSIPLGNYILSIQWRCIDVTASVSNISIFTKIHI